MLPYMSLLFEMNAARFRVFDGICGNLSESRQVALYHYMNILYIKNITSEICPLRCSRHSLHPRRLFSVQSPVRSRKLLISSPTSSRQCCLNIVPELEYFSASICSAIYSNLGEWPLCTRKYRCVGLRWHAFGDHMCIQLSMSSVSRHIVISCLASACLPCLRRRLARPVVILV